MTAPHPYEALTPDLILDAIEACGLPADGRLLALNSYENRVLQVGIDGQAPMIAKFYRPARWSAEQILEEHRFALELADAEIPVIAPWRSADGRTLIEHGGFLVALFPRRGGRAPEAGDLDQLEWIGRFIGRIHLCGQGTAFQYRPSLDPTHIGVSASQHVLASKLLPHQLRAAYTEVSSRLLDAIDSLFAEHPVEHIKVHGDCHHGNILWTEEGPHFVDLDDCIMGPAVQDLWMMLHGDRRDRTLQLSAILDGYRLFHDFDPREIALIEPLRSLRLLHYSAWLARRWDDPAFPNAFPWVATEAYWTQHIADLGHQLEAMREPPLHLY